MAWSCSLVRCLLGGTASAFRGCWTPGPQVVVGQPVLTLDLRSVPGEESRRGHAVQRVELAVPLPQPRLELQQPGKERGQFVGSCGVVGEVRGQRLRLLTVVPARPAVEVRRAGSRCGIGYDPLLRYVQLAACPPVRRLEKVCGLVLVRHRNRVPDLAL